MPEAPEIDTDKLHETIQEQLEREWSGLLKKIALTTALLAALAAIAALRAGATVNEALVLKTEAARLQSEASNQWAYYQAKGIKSAVQEASRSAWLANGKTPPREFEESTKKYAAQQAEIQKEAQAREHERDAKSEEADHLLHRHHGFAKSVAIFQVAIALGAVAALTRNRLVWFGSLLLGVAGAVFLAVTHFG
jgi:hypothetical protein